MGLKAVGIDVEKSQWEHAQTLNVFEMTDLLDTNFVTQIQKDTGGGVHAVTTLSTSVRVQDAEPSIIRIGGNLMVVPVVSMRSSFSIRLAFQTSNYHFVNVQTAPNHLPIISVTVLLSPV
ncbi:hypothetical protein COCC4DRAFT_22741 [Bipolaris maydis ATCC 48331]|uniref:Alcohol dehydrogenase-like C-terminal domain-containing protein n=2 Tax=Cochliobolus heterostrophus TaxID=5016 RepID=M2TJ58_COCH5|nr:uncharacterized protein COCC4DRAFT_22741 [Bipolaris maydis ATCC 48331]EMD86539.1 hypothetical protein COCHEDRAFT_1034953 [Bipolaris maydis C5]ENI06487.1 hypothetical protein COCC4DRAFT_22741 [Bipolaris maydis ATCC 48331]KAJ6214148.1 hypothetical protein PSV09DRAFT_1034953 [Bipolaris maydis]